MKDGFLLDIQDTKRGADCDADIIYHHKNGEGDRLEVHGGAVVILHGAARIMAGILAQIAESEEECRMLLDGVDKFIVHKFKQETGEGR